MPIHRPLRVCFLVDTGAWGGMEIHTLELARTLAARGHNCTIVEFGTSFFERYGGEPPERCSLRSLDFARSDPERTGVGGWYRRLRSLHADVCLLVKGGVDGGSLQLDIAARLRFPRYVTVEQLTPPPRPALARDRHLGGVVPGLGLWWYRHMAGVRARSLAPHRIVGISTTIARLLVEDYAFPQSKVVCIPHGIDGDLYHPDTALGSAQRASWGIPEDATVFGTVGRLAVGHKGQDIALEAFARLCRRGADRELWYVLVGEGPDRAQLERQALEAGVADRVVFAGFSDRPWEVYPALDIFLMPSRFEGLGLVLLEAMASGCVPIGMGVGGINDILGDPEFGWLVPAQDREAFFAAMREAAQRGPEQRRAMGCAARAHVLRNFRADRQLARFADLVEEIGGTTAKEPAWQS